eukprot:6174344-Lingulodinium_polyedra.AAC.1
MPRRRALCRRDQPGAKVSPLRADNSGPEGAVDHGLAPAVEAMLRDDLSLESAAASVGSGVDVLSPFAISNVSSNGVHD